MRQSRAAYQDTMAALFKVDADFAVTNNREAQLGTELLSINKELAALSSREAEYNRQPRPDADGDRCRELCEANHRRADQHESRERARIGFANCAIGQSARFFRLSPIDQFPGAQPGGTPKDRRSLSTLSNSPRARSFILNERTMRAFKQGANMEPTWRKMWTRKFRPRKAARRSP
jgi:hypothetical protein